MTIPNKPGEQVAGAVSQTRKRLRRMVLITTLAPALLFGLMFLVAVIIALADVDGAAAVIRAIRDLMLVFIALELALIFVAIAVLLVQVSRLLNLLTEEIAPLLDATNETVQAAQNTVDFAGRNVLGPFIDFSGFMTTLMTLVLGMFGLRRAVSKATHAKRDSNGD
jgi:uncharacterized BrkB/YihY/UPF0761 family membrane protein